jgi:hypothetical protein
MAKVLLIISVPAALGLVTASNAMPIAPGAGANVRVPIILAANGYGGIAALRLMSSLWTPPYPGGYYGAYAH